MRTYSHISPTVRVPSIPMYQLGWAGYARHKSLTRGMGAAASGGAQIVGASAPVAALATTTALTSMVNAGTLSMSTAFIPVVGAAVAVVISIIAGLWAAHDARVAGAKDENTVLNSAVQAFDGGLKAIFAAANSSDPTVNIPATSAVQQCQSLLTTFWQKMAPHMTGPGRADASGFGTNCGTVNTAKPCSGMIGGHACDKTCTASCCVGCQELTPTISQAIAVFNAGGGTIVACGTFSNNYGYVGRGSYSLTYTAPTLASSASGDAAAVSSALSGEVGGVPLWMLLAGGAALLFAMR